jgi:hypothetical protein
MTRVAEDSRKYKEMVAWLEGKVKDRQDYCSSRSISGGVVTASSVAQILRNFVVSCIQRSNMLSLGQLTKSKICNSLSVDHSLTFGWE